MTMLIERRKITRKIVIIKNIPLQEIDVSENDDDNVSDRAVSRNNAVYAHAHRNIARNKGKWLPIAEIMRSFTRNCCRRI